MKTTQEIQITKGGVKMLKKHTLEEITDIALNKMSEKRLIPEDRVIEIGDKYNELREKISPQAKAHKQAYSNYVLSLYVILS